MTVEDRLKELMEIKSGNVRAFANEHDFPYTTLRSILERGVLNAKAETVFAICKALNIKPESLVENEISPVVIHGDNNGIAANVSNISGSVTIGATLQKSDLHDIVNNLSDRELQEKILDKVVSLNKMQSEIVETQRMIADAINRLTANQEKVLDNMKSVDDSFKELIKN